MTTEQNDILANNKETEEQKDETMRTIYEDIQKVKQERMLLQQRNVRNSASLASSLQTMLSQDVITSMSNQINMLLKQSKLPEIEFISYASGCSMLNITQLTHSISQILQHYNPNCENLQQESIDQQNKIEMLSKELRECKYNMQLPKEKEKYTETKLNKSSVCSERKINELEANIRTLKNKIVIKDKEIEKYKAQADGKDNKKGNTTLLYKQLDEKQYIIKKLDRELSQSQRNCQSLEQLVQTMKNSAYLDGRYREAQAESESLKGEIAVLKETAEANLEEISNINKSNELLQQKVTMLEMDNTQLLQQINQNPVEEKELLGNECNALKKINTDLTIKNSQLENEIFNLRNAVVCTSTGQQITL